MDSGSLNRPTFNENHNSKHLEVNESKWLNVRKYA